MSFKIITVKEVKMETIKIGCHWGTEWGRMAHKWREDFIFPFYIFLICFHHMYILQIETKLYIKR